MQNRIHDGHRRSLFKRLIWKELWILTIEDFDLHFDEQPVHFSWWILYHCTGFAQLVWGRLRVHWSFVYSDWFVCSVWFCSLLPRLTLILSFLGHSALAPPRGGSTSRVSPQSCQSHESLWVSWYSRLLMDWCQMHLFLHNFSRKVTLYSTSLCSSCLSQLRTGPTWATWSSGHPICEDSGSAVWKENRIMMWDSRKEPWAVSGLGRREGGCGVED